ncbi:HD domain-containing protein [Falsihalocynthiibacter arcticus]|uniref:HD domain-containing protein n=1 Tax=Falsihalocynthiibacter arcticus TaxID=1579316 RepID=A0A126V5U8_9RHOB|nr:HD domain-containing protein [Falsihalocynthiibacter arcticus]AML53079.1 hypothetical protein RC74_19080 [Falsihalocynthiibacter arcticus]
MTPEDLATARHEGQFRKGANPTPYVTHCAEVADTVARHGGEADTVSGAWLHDTVEDTKTTLAEIDQLFGNIVAALVGKSLMTYPFPKKSNAKHKLRPHLTNPQGRR